MCGGCHLHGNTLTYHCEIDTRILTLRSLYFFQTTAASSLSRFLIVFLKKYFNAQQLGILLGVRPGIGFLSSFIWGFIGDLTQRHLLCLISGLCISTIAINGLMYHQIGTNFWYAFALLNIVTIFGAAGCLFDAIVILILGETKDKGSTNDDGTKAYGATRLWGALGWGLGALICGTLLAQYGENYLFYFYDITYSIPILLMIILSSYLTINTDNTQSIEHTEEWLKAAPSSELVTSPPHFSKKQPKKERQKLDTKLFRRKVCTLCGFIFFSNLILFGTCMAFVENYLFLFLLQKFNATTVLCGLTIGMMVIGEIPIFYWSKWWIDKVGIIGLLSIAHIAYIVRCVAYTLLPQTRYYSWFILFIEPLHGLTYGGMWIASVEYGSRLAPKSMQGTMLGLICGLYQGLAVCFGTVIGGVIYHHFGPVYMYRLSAVIIGGWMIFFQCSLRLIRCCSNDDGIRLIFNEKMENVDVQEQSERCENINSIAEGPSVSLLVDNDMLTESQSINS